MVRYVITGGPGTGKSTTINELIAVGYAALPEAARLIIQEEQHKAEGILPWTFYEKFQERVFARQQELEKKIMAAEVFLDRGMADNLAYCRLGKVNPPQGLVATIVDNRYTQVFVLSPLADYVQDAERKEDEGHARELHEMIIQVYRECGYNPVMVPRGTPQERIKFILKNRGGKNHGRML